MTSIAEPDQPNETVQRVLRAIADGTDVDWAELPYEQDETDGPVLGQLRVLAHLAAVHRADLDDEGTSEWWGHLRLIQQVGRGAFGTVYRAWDSRLDREVALKLIRGRGAEHRAPESTFIEEARLLARVRHPNVLTVHGAERIEGRDGIWTEFIQGRTMAEIVRRDGPLTPNEVTSIGVDVCRAVGAIHAAGLLHRDIKAQNIMRDERGRVVVMDLGAGTEYSLAAQSAADALLGTPLYLAPEILAGESHTPQGDVYSLGVLLYHLLTGGFPVVGDLLETVRDAHARGDRVPVEARRQDVPARLASVIARAIATAPSDRFQSVEDLQTSLERCLPADPRRRRKLVGSVAAATLTIAGLVGFAWWTTARLGPAGSTTRAAFKQISFTGKISDAALSPDGRTIAYVADDSNGFRLMVEDLSTAAHRELWRSAMLTRPRWSRDGSKLAFYAIEGDLFETGGQWTIPREGGTPRRLAPGALLAWSPEGERVANAKADYRRIEIVSTSGTVLQRITLPELSWILDVDWQASSEHIVVLGQNAQRQFEVWKVSADGAEKTLVHRDTLVLTTSRWSAHEDAVYCLRRRDDGTELIAIDGQSRGAPRVVSSLNSGAEGLSLSADGTTALFVQNRSWTNLWRFEVDGDRADPQPITHGTGNYTRPRISPDGQWIAAVFASQGASDNNTRLVKIPRGGGDIVSLTNANARDNFPAWSPNGQRVAFGSNRDGFPGIWVMSAEGGAPVKMQLAGVDPNLAVSWTPDGQIAWQQRVGSGSSRFRLRDLANGRESSLTTATSVGHEFNPRFSPRGDQVALQITGQGQPGLWSLSWPGRVKRLLAPGLVPVGWSASGDTIFGYRMAPGSPDIWRVASSGGPVNSIGRVKNGRIVGGDASGDGKWIILSVQERNGDVWMVRGFDARN